MAGGFSIHHPPSTKNHCPTLEQLLVASTIEAHDKGQHPATTPCPFSTPAAMDVTKFVISLREKALLYGDYSTYWSQLSGKLLNCRKKLNIATKSRAKFNPKAPVTPEQIAENHECVEPPSLLYCSVMV